MMTPRPDFHAYPLTGRPDIDPQVLRRWHRMLFLGVVAFCTALTLAFY